MSTANDLTVGFIGAGMMASAIMVRYQFSYNHSFPFSVHISSCVGSIEKVNINLPRLIFVLPA